MIDTDLRYLEGSAAMAERIKSLSGRSPNAAQVAFASSCLLHGRLFWDSARQAPLETKPLLLYYGASAFAKAVVAAKNGCKPQDISQAHGLSCAPGNGDRIANYTVSAKGLGLFQEFNDVVAPLNRICYYEGSSLMRRVLPTANSKKLSNFRVRLLDCFARMPGLEQVYQQCTQAEPSLLTLQVSNESSKVFSIRVDFSKLFEGVEGLRKIVSEARARAPFLDRWRLREAGRAWDCSVLVFDNYPVPGGELDLITGGPVAYGARLVAGAEPFDALADLPPLSGGYDHGGANAYLQPLGGEHVSEYSVTLAALLGLSSLVRYQPDAWTACIHRRGISNRKVDDELLPLIELFMENVEYRWPRFIADVLLGR